MKLLNLITNIQDLRSKFQSSDDDPLTDKHILDWINKYRAILIRQDYEKNRTLSSFNIQELPLELECVDKSLSFTTGTNILRSKIKLPKLVEGYTRDYITYIGRIDYEMRFTEVSEQSISSMQYTKYATKWPRYFLREGYVCVPLPPTENLTKIMARGIFEEPQKIEELKGNIDPFNPYDWEYPISAHLAPVIEKMIAEQEFKITFAIPKDNSNDGSQQ